MYIRSEIHSTTAIHFQTLERANLARHVLLCDILKALERRKIFASYCLLKNTRVCKIHKFVKSMNLYKYKFSLQTTGVPLHFRKRYFQLLATDVNSPYKRDRKMRNVRDRIPK